TVRENPEKAFWKSLSALDWLAFVMCALGLFLMFARDLIPNLPGPGLLRFLGTLAAFYLLYRFWTRWRSQVLWSLRNRLIVAYLFIAVVPIILLLIFSSLLGQIIYSQLGAYLLYHAVEDRLEMLSNSAEAIAAVESSLPAANGMMLDRALAGQVLLEEKKQLPGLLVNFGADPAYFQLLAGREVQSFTGLVQNGNELWLVGMRQSDSPGGTRYIELSVPVTSEVLEQLAPDLGPLGLTLWQTGEQDSSQSTVLIAGK